MDQEKIQENKQALREIIEESYQVMENCKHEISDLKFKSLISTILLLITAIISISYPLYFKGEKFISWVYLTYWFFTISLLISRVKLYMKFLSKVFVNRSAETLISLAEYQLEKIRQNEYDELRRKTNSTGNSSRI